MSESAPPTVGERVLLEGTGRWWKGARYVATVADVRDDAGGGTVKVRYLDGGYKRFARATYDALAARARAHHDEAAGDEPGLCAETVTAARAHGGAAAVSYTHLRAHETDS